MTLLNATIIFHCEEGLIPNTTIVAICGSTGVWSPNPANHLCVNQSSGKKYKINYFCVTIINFAPTAFCIAPAVPTGAHISDQSTGYYLEGSNITIQCDDVPHIALTTVCHVDGSWRPTPLKLACTTVTTTSESGIQYTSSSLILLCHYYY